MPPPTKVIIAVALFVLTGHVACFFGAGRPTPPAETVHAMVVYAQDSDDHYPFPSKAMRDYIYSRLAGLYLSMSYGGYQITFKETTDRGGYFVSKQAVPFYKNNYNPQSHVKGFGMFNEEILEQVRQKKGDDYFGDVDMIIMVGPDGGPGWYADRVNATGFAMLGVDFQVGDKTFRKGQGQGGITVEIGSSVGTPDPSDDHLMNIEDIQWTFAHEYGHWLGLGHRGGNLGIYSLMSRELHRNARVHEVGPPPLDIFHIMQLAWLDESDSTRVKIVNNFSSAQEITLNHIRSRAGLVLVRIDPPNSKEKYYLSYHHQKQNPFDGVYMGEGLLVWRKLGGQIELKRPVSQALSLNAKSQLAGSQSDFLRESGEFQLNATSRNVRSSQRTGVVTVTDVREFDDRVRFGVSYRQE